MMVERVRDREIERATIMAGMVSIFENGVPAALAGNTTTEEAVRAAWATRALIGIRAHRRSLKDQSNVVSY